MSVIKNTTLLLSFSPFHFTTNSPTIVAPYSADAATCRPLNAGLPAARRLARSRRWASTSPRVLGWKKREFQKVGFFVVAGAWERESWAGPNVKGGRWQREGRTSRPPRLCPPRPLAPLASQPKHASFLPQTHHSAVLVTTCVASGLRVSAASYERHAPRRPADARQGTMRAR